MLLLLRLLLAFERLVVCCSVKLSVFLDRIQLDPAIESLVDALFSEDVVFPATDDDALIVGSLLLLLNQAVFVVSDLLQQRRQCQVFLHVHGDSKSRSVRARRGLASLVDPSSALLEGRVHQLKIVVFNLRTICVRVLPDLRACCIFHLLAFHVALGHSTAALLLPFTL